MANISVPQLGCPALVSSSALQLWADSGGRLHQTTAGAGVVVVIFLASLVDGIDGHGQQAHKGGDQARDVEAGIKDEHLTHESTVAKFKPL